MKTLQNNYHHLTDPKQKFGLKLWHYTIL